MLTILPLIPLNSQDAGLLREVIRRLKMALELRKSPAWDPTEVFVTLSLLGMLAPPQTFAFLTAQRTGDMLRLLTRDAFTTTITDTIAPKPSRMVSVLVTRGKTVRSRGPYPLHLPAGGIAEKILCEAVIQSKGPYIFMPHVNTVLDDARETQEVKAMLRSFKIQDAETEEQCPGSRDLRRASLAFLAMDGESNADLRSVSRHKDDDILRIYLGAGLLDETLRRTQHRLISKLENILRTPSANCCSVVPLKGTVYQQ